MLAFLTSQNKQIIVEFNSIIWDLLSVVYQLHYVWGPLIIQLSKFMNQYNSSDYFMSTLRTGGCLRQVVFFWPKMVSRLEGSSFSWYSVSQNNWCRINNCIFWTASFKIFQLVLVNETCLFWTFHLSFSLQVQENLSKCVSMMSDVVQVLQELASSALQQTILLSG